MKLLRRPLNSPAAVSLLIGVVVFFCVMGVRGAGGLQSLELYAYDLFLELQPAAPPDSRIVIVEITENDIQTLGSWPLTDATIARLLEILTSHGPRAIGIDIYRDIPVPPGREKLDAILLGEGAIVMVEKFGDENSAGVPATEVLRGTEQVGFNDIIIDRDGVVRRGLIFMDDGETVFFSFALRLAMLYLQEEGIFPQPGEPDPAYLRLGQTTYRPFEPDDGGYVGADALGYQTLLDFKGGPFRSFTLTRVMSGKVQPEAFRGKVALVGVTAVSVNDIFHIPFNNDPRSDERVFGVALHARAVSQFIRGALYGQKPVSIISDAKEWTWALLWSLIGAVLGRFVRSPWRFSILAAVGALIIALSGYLALSDGVWIPVAPPVITYLISASLVTAYMSNQEKAQRAILMQLFSKHVSPDVAEDIWKRRDQFLEGGRPRSQRLTATVLFTDLKGFTSVSERFEPQALMDWLNEYMDAMSGAVIENEGVVNKYIGDAIMAVFGVPLARASEHEIRRDAANAVACALAMEEKLNRLNAGWEEEGLPTAKMRVGVFTGPLVAGSLGGSDRLEYTVIGDTVNTASRLESFDKDLAPESVCRILIGEATLKRLDNRFHVEKVGEVHLKGKEERVTVYLVKGRAEQPNGDAGIKPAT